MERVRHKTVNCFYTTPLLEGSSLLETSETSYDVAIVGDANVGKSTLLRTFVNNRFPRKKNGFNQSLIHENSSSLTRSLTDSYATTGKYHGSHGSTLAKPDTTTAVRRKSSADCTLFTDAHTRDVYRNGKRLATFTWRKCDADFPAMFTLTVAKCNASIVVYSVMSEKSFRVAAKKIEEIFKAKGKNFPCVLVGNKLSGFCNDVTKNDGTNDVMKRVVSHEKALNLAVKYNCPYVEVSTPLGENVGDVFTSLVRKLNLSNSLEGYLKDQGKHYLTPKSKRRKTVPSLYATVTNNVYSHIFNKSII